MATIGDIQKEINILNHLIEYSSYYTTHEDENPQEAPSKETVLLLARLTLYYAEDELVPPFNKNLFNKIRDLASERINLLTVSPDKTPKPNMPSDLDELVEIYEAHKNDKEAKADVIIKQGSYYYAHLFRRKQITEQPNNAPQELVTVIKNGFPQYDEPQVADLAQKIKDSAVKLAEDPLSLAPQTAEQIILDWQNDPKTTQKLTPDEIEGLTKVIDYQNTYGKIYHSQKLVNFQKELDKLNSPESINKLSQEILAKNPDLNPNEARYYAQTNIEQQTRAVILAQTSTEVEFFVNDAIGKAVESLGGDQAPTAQILKKDADLIKFHITKTVASPKFDFALAPFTPDGQTLQDLITQTASAVISAQPRLNQAQVKIAVLALKNAVPQVFQQHLNLTPSIQMVSSQNQYQAIDAQLDPRHAQGTAFGTVFSFFLNPRTDIFTHSFLGFVKGAGESILGEYGSLPPIVKLQVFLCKDKNEFDSLVDNKNITKRINATQLDSLWNFSQEYKKFSEDHKTISKLFWIKSRIDYEALTGSVAGFAIQITPGLAKNILSHPDYALYFFGEYAKSIAFEIVKEKTIRPIINDFAVKILKTHRVDKAGIIRFRPTLWLQDKIGKLTKTIFNKLPSFITKLIVPGAGWIGLVLSFAPGLAKQILKYGSLALGAFLAWLYSISPWLAAGSLIGGIIGAILGSAGGPVTALLGFIGGSFIGGAISLGLYKILSGAGGLFSGAASAATASAAGLPALTTGFASAALPVTGAFIITTAGLNLFHYEFLQAGFNPYRDTGQAGIIKASKELNDVFQKAANDACIPVAALKAISQIEAKNVWHYTPDEIAKFSQDGWWNSASQAELERGYCIDTCQKTDIDCATINRKTRQYCAPPPPPVCSETTVYGPMQFEEITWGYKYGYEEENLKKRCNLATSVTEAALKLKANSNSPNCTSWNKDTVRLVAEKYCGSCGTIVCGNKPPEPWPEEYTACYQKNKSCGYDYCGKAWEFYQEYNR